MTHCTVGWTFAPTDSHVIKQLRVLVLKAASGIEGMTGLVQEGKRQFTMMCADINSVHPELRDVVMNVAVANGGLEGMSLNQRFVHAHLYTRHRDKYHMNIGSCDTSINKKDWCCHGRQCRLRAAIAISLE